MAERHDVTKDRSIELGPVEPMSPPQRFLDSAAELGVAFDEGDLECLGHHLALVFEANTIMNLTAVTDADEAWIRHVFDSLTLMPVLADLPEGASVLDVGSGAGFPGVPIAIVRPDLRVTLLEATAKKAEFLRLCAQRLNMGFEVLTMRAEAAGAFSKGAHRDAVDAVVCRAVGRLPVALELCLPLARVGGFVAFTKGAKADEELAEAKHALHLLCARHAGTIDTPTGRIVIIEKTRATPRTYPRRDGEPKRQPLGVNP